MQKKKKNDKEFSKSLANLAEVYVNDAFGAAHRAHSSTAGVSEFLPAVCGYLMQKEIAFIGGALEAPKTPFIAILGGAKVSDKIGVITNLIDKVDTLIIGGGMAYTFLKAQGYEIGTSICEDDKLDLAKEILEKAKTKGINFLLPIDNLIANKFDAEADTKIVDCGHFSNDWMGMDIGPETIRLFCDALVGAGTIIWNGPMGVFEFPKFANGTLAMAKAVAESGAVSIIGGGDSVSAVVKLGYADKMSHISTGGGASLEYMEGKVLPGVDCLNEK